MYKNDDIFDLEKTAKNIIGLRENNNMTLREFNDKVFDGLNKHTELMRWEKAEELINLSDLIIICNYFNIKIASILALKMDYKHLENILN